MTGVSMEEGEGFGPDPLPQAASFAGSVWFAWTAPSAGNVRFWIPRPEGDESWQQKRLVLYRLAGGSSVTSLTPLASSLQRSTDSLADVVTKVAAADVVIVQLLAELSTPLPLSWRMSCTCRVRFCRCLARVVSTALTWTHPWCCGDARVLPAPSNDQFANRAALVGTGGTVALDFTYATVEPGERVGNNSASLWFKITPGTNAMLQMMVEGQTDAAFAVFFDATTVAALVDVNAAQSSTYTAVFTLLGGRTYALQLVASSFVDSVTLKWSLSGMCPEHPCPWLWRG
jgi:hypothetical protein